jgi:hypothetical protein
MDGIVRQLDNGTIIECSAVHVCMANNPQIKVNEVSCNKNCMLSVKDHGTRCRAYPQDTSVWIIDDDMTKIKGIPTWDRSKITE